MKFSDANIGKLPGAWAASCAEVVDMIDSPGLLQSLTQSLGTLISFDESRTILFSTRNAPSLLFDSHPDLRYREGWENYVKDSYAISPTFRLFQTGRLPGVHRVRDIARLTAGKIDLSHHRVSADASEEAGYLTHGMPAGYEELCVGLELTNRLGGLITLTRRRTPSGYSPKEIELIKSVRPFVSSAFRRHWEKSRTVDKGNDVPSAFAEFRMLSPREFQIAQLLIKGHSSLSISLTLNISVTTVKTHRKNLYAKLGIATQWELFSLYVKRLEALTGQTR